MAKKCFFCYIQSQEDDKRITESENFFSRYDDFPVSKGHAEVILKSHIVSFFDLSEGQIKELYELLRKTKEIVETEFKPDGFNIGINEGTAAGQTQDHLHVHLIPRYKGDAANPKGGIRNIFPQKADYTEEAKSMPSRKDFI